MARLLIHVEGQTEEGFVNEVLRDHLVAKGYHAVEARIIGNAGLRQRRGGIRAWSSVRMDIARRLKQDPGCVATTLVDYYGLPQGEGRAWPGRAMATTLPAAEKARCVEDAVLADLAAAMGRRFDAGRFIPFVAMHEFEGLLFSDCAAFSRGIGRPDLESGFQEIRDQFPTPEDIDDSPVTAPSKRVEALVPGYEKPLLGALAILEIGLARIRAECPHFKGWLTRLEARALQLE
ncbi:MAG TPA: DUF4276 family protein [Bryobacteraceae bacterium]|nr:DUF4276 family protein [Bryobacteraceae bacterium]